LSGVVLNVANMFMGHACEHQVSAWPMEREALHFVKIFRQRNQEVGKVARNFQTKLK
jgi:hypothetical protein